MWRCIAWLLSRRGIARRLVARAKKTPYVHIEGYMNRYWLFNGYKKDENGQMHTPIPWLPSVRVHHILRADLDTVPHDHPWNARTILLNGWYNEIRCSGPDNNIRTHLCHTSGETTTLRFNEYHTVTSVSRGGVWTLFFTWRYRGTWGFWVDGAKVPYREYLARGDKL